MRGTTGRSRPTVLVALALVVLGCSPAGIATQPQSEERAQGARMEPSRTLVIVLGRSPDSLGSKPLRDTGQSGTPRTAIRAFNAGLAVNDERETPRPYLAEALPQLGSESWRVLPDGRMETTYRLKPNLTWHDGTPLGADDFAFSWRVYATPELGWAASPPISVLEDVLAVDPRTVLARWRQPYAQADALQAVDFPPLPRHLLEGVLVQRDPDAFVAHPFWLTEYVGLGPYRLRQVELGSFVEGAAFGDHALGRPKIESVRFLAIADPNVVVTNLLSDAAQVATDSTLTDEQQASVVEREWQTRNAGIVLRSPLGVRYTNIQLRPDYASTPALLDLRVRKALAHATDRQVLVDAVTQGLTTTAETLVLREVEYYPALDRALTKYPHDLRRAQQLMAEAGFAPGPDGVYSSQADGRFAFEISSPQGARNEAEITIMADGLRRAGMDASIRVIPRAQIAQPLVSSHYPGFFNGHITRAFDAPIRWLRASEIARAENRWRGTNYAGFNHPEFERLASAWDIALERAQRNQYVVDMLRVVSEEVPTIPLYYSVNYLAHVANLRGPLITLSPDSISWNLHEWYWVG